MKEFKRRIGLLWMFGRIHQWRLLIIGFCLLGGFWLLINLLTCNQFVQTSVSSWLSLWRLYISGNLPISSRWLNFWCIAIHSSLFWSTVFLKYHFELLLVSDFIWISSLFSLSTSENLRFYFTKVCLFSFIVLFYCLWNLYIMYFSLWSFLFLILTLGFILFFCYFI